MKNLKKQIATVGSVAAIILSLIVVARWWYYVNRYSVNILFWDQWDFYNAFFENKNLWEIFRWQHGPHRQGIGFIITRVIASLSSWDTRVEAFTIAGVVCLAMITALALRARFKPRLFWADVAIPLIFLTPVQFEIFAGTPNLSHGSVPLLLFMLYCLIWVISHGAWRLTAILILNFFLIYTGFGVFVGIITPFLFGIDAFYAYRTHDRKGFTLAFTGIAVSLLSAGSFFVGYRFSPSVDNFQFPIRQWWEYPQFMSLMTANFFGIKGVSLYSYLAGFLILLLMLTLAVVYTVCMVRRSPSDEKLPKETAIAVLVSFTLIFCVNTAIGRISLGLPAAQSSRYMTYLIPGFFGIYLWLVWQPVSTLRRILLAAVVICFVFASFPLREADQKGLRWYRGVKTCWKTVYLQKENIELATQAANFPIYPSPERTRLKEKLEYLKRERLNLYKE